MTGFRRSQTRSTDGPPRDGLVRLWAPEESELPGLAVREDSGGSGNGQPTLTGHFAVFNRFTEIDSFFEGNFMEKIAPGAFRQTFKDDRNNIRVLLNHGRDEQLGMKPIARVDVLKEDKEGGFYEAPMLRGVPELVMEGLREKQYGASFKFRVTQEKLVSNPEPSTDNPRGLDERTIERCQVYEFGPVTFPAYPQASAGLRSTGLLSGTDEYLLHGIVEPELVRMAGTAELRKILKSNFGISVPRAIGQREDENEAASEREAADDTESAEQAEAEQASATREGDTPEAAADAAADTSKDGTGAQDADAEESRGTDAASETRSDEEADKGYGSTPLVGPAGHRESWRL